MSKEIVLPEGIDVFELSSDSPDLKSVERLWSLTNEIVANHQKIGSETPS